MPERLPNLVLAAADSAEAAEGKPLNAVSVFIVYEDEDGKFHAVIHAPIGLRRLASETIQLATEAAHDPAAGLH
ncbi:hypothetical protein ACFQZQ_03000 [Lysobacter koreensis]|uniref:Uncharacterized protein n=1 Tax=Lysobacter koreensis TaxID=266122 RepID=A0ABW2YP75_9GAMM